MDKELYWNILDQKPKDILPLFKGFRADFYLAGGTGLALQLGHRYSIDFDFFSPETFSTEALFQKIQEIFTGYSIVKTQEEKDTLTVEIDSSIKVSFFNYPYKLIKPLVDDENFSIASVEDIGAMKLSAITSRSILKDYLDIYFILHNINLHELLDLTKEKFPSIDINPVLKSLVYFDDIQEDPILFKHNDDVSFEQIKKYLSDTVRNYLNKSTAL